MKSFPAKILLFGEYGVVQGGEALSIPYFGYSGSLVQDPHSSSQHILKRLVQYLRNNPLTFHFDLEKFAQDVDHGLSFQSTIPQKYGLGSSGALVAALYDGYAKPTKDLKKLKKQLGELESFFHGKSSAIAQL